MGPRRRYPDPHTLGHSSGAGLIRKTLAAARGGGKTESMDTRRIGSLDVSVVGLGTNNFGMGMQGDEVPPVVNAALESGITFFDTSDSYGDSERRLGKALGQHRDEVVIATKFGSPVGKEGTGGAAPAYVREAIERSLHELGTDRIDLYQLHRPDPATPLLDTLGVLDELVRQGKIREIGCSNFSAELLREADGGASGQRARFASVQNHYNLLHRGDEREVLPECHRLGIVYLPFFPLAGGMLTGKYAKGQAPAPGTRMQRWGDRASGVLSDRNFEVVRALERVGSLPRSQPVGSGLRLVDREADHPVGHRRSHQCRSGAGKRGGWRVASIR